MGREIRRVPPHWEHPRYTADNATSRNRIGEYRPCLDEDYETKAATWIAEFHQWERGEHEGQPTNYSRYYWEYAGIPDEETCRPKFNDEPTWFQVYETVSEGTPVTPAFETAAELVDYLVEHGDFWDQSRGNGGWSRENAESFVGRGHAFSMMVERTATGVTIKEPRDGS